MQEYMWEWELNVFVYVELLFLMFGRFASLQTDVADPNEKYYLLYINILYE